MSKFDGITRMHLFLCVVFRFSNLNDTLSVLEMGCCFRSRKAHVLRELDAQSFVQHR